MNEGMLSPDVYERSDSGSISVGRLVHKRVTHQAEMRSPRSAGDDDDQYGYLPYVVVVTTNTETPPEVHETASRLERLSALPNDWDGSGAIAPTRDALVRASSLVASMYADISGGTSEWRAPHVSASEDGEVTFEWWNKGRKLTLYIGAARAEFIKVSGPNINADMESGVLTRGAFFPLWRWLFS